MGSHDLKPARPIIDRATAGKAGDFMAGIIDPSDSAPTSVRLGMAALTRAAHAGADLSPVADALRATLMDDPTDAGALMDLSVIEQLNGDLERGLTLQALALHHAQVFGTASSEGKPVRLLALAAPLPMGDNTPVDFLVRDDAPVGLRTLYIADGIPLPDPLPDHDLAFVVAPGDSDASRIFLDAIARRVQDWPRPVLNAPANIAMLERDRSGAALAEVPGLRLPENARCNRAKLAAVGEGALELRDVIYGGQFPVIVRPVGAHAGRGLEKLDSTGQIASYLAECTDTEFFLSDFIDYRSEDGAYRKYRIVFVDGRPFPCHMAIAEEWKVWYMNADMATSSEKRAEEESFMAGFASGFGRRHADALSGMARAFGLDYFGIDCAEDRSGNLVMFEADNALIVHDMDSPQVFPYKAPRMREVFTAFTDMIARRAQARSAPDARRLTG